VPAARNRPREIVGRSITCPDDDRKYPSREQWSELQRDDRIAAECASHPLPRNKLSLLSWQAAVARAALLHSCSDQQRMLMRRMRERRSQLQIGPTSRTCDSVWFLFPCRNFDSDRNFKQAYSPIPLRIFGPAHFLQPREVCFSRSRGNVRDEYCSDALLLLRYGCLRLPRACHRSPQQIPTLNLPPIIAPH
jgi:hypothetical protein